MEQLSEEEMVTETLCALLPFKLQCICNGTSYKHKNIVERTGILIQLDMEDNHAIINKPNGYLIAEIIKIIPILRPLSDLLDLPKNHYNEELAIELSDIIGVLTVENFITAIQKSSYYSINHIRYSQIERFFNKNHFDWKFDLINKGLAYNLHEYEGIIESYK